MALTIKTGDITKAAVDFIVQQCNCVTLNAKGLALQIEKQFPEVNVYQKRKPSHFFNTATLESRDRPGTYQLISTSKQSTIVCLFGQYRPGPPASRLFDPFIDSTKQRLIWFRQALFHFGNWLANQNRISKPTVAIPWHIGCGLAGGSWQDYSNVLIEFSQQYHDTFRVIIYRRKEEEEDE